MSTVKTFCNIFFTNCEGMLRKNFYPAVLNATVFSRILLYYACVTRFHPSKTTLLREIVGGREGACVQTFAFG